MKSTSAAQSNIDMASLTIPDAEEMIEDALNELAYSQDPGLARALRFLAPPGYQVIVELCSENGRSKRRDAPAGSWSPEEDEVRIYFERAGGADSHPRPARAQRTARAPGFAESETAEALASADMDARVKDLCEALGEAERGGHAFIALKWFRDSFLPRKPFGWNNHPDARQIALAEAIQRGMVTTGKVANPKTPAYPTTTIKLSRSDDALSGEEPASLPNDAEQAEPAEQAESLAAVFDGGLPDSGRI